jgi:hypothetical protein
MAQFWNLVEHLSINSTDFVIMELPKIFTLKLNIFNFVYISHGPNRENTFPELCTMYSNV